jgi:hypothetical protein
LIFERQQAGAKWAEEEYVQKGGSENREDEGRHDVENLRAHVCLLIRSFGRASLGEERGGLEETTVDDMEDDEYRDSKGRPREYERHSDEESREHEEGRENGSAGRCG